MTGRFVFFAISIFGVLAPVSIAIADEGGWEPWRVALAAWPFAVFFAFFLAVIVEADK